MQTFNRLRRQTAELDYSAVETNFTLGLAELWARLSRRSLVVLFTDFVDTVTAELMVENVARLASRHLVLFVTLRDPELEAIVDAEPACLPTTSRDRSRPGPAARARGGAGAAAPARRAVPGGAARPLRHRPVNRYLDIKRRELI